jgi:hypothetical protein
MSVVTRYIVHNVLNPNRKSHANAEILPRVGSIHLILIWQEIRSVGDYS